MDKNERLEKFIYNPKWMLPEDKTKAKDEFDSLLSSLSTLNAGALKRVQLHGTHALPEDQVSVLEILSRPLLSHAPFGSRNTLFARKGFLE